MAHVAKRWLNSRNPEPEGDIKNRQPPRLGRRVKTKKKPRAQWVGTTGGDSQNLLARQRQSKQAGRSRSGDQCSSQSIKFVNG